MKNPIENFKRQVQSIVPMDNDTFNFCLPFIKQKNLEKGEFFVQPGKKSNQLAFIISGLFRIYQLKDSAEVTSCFCSENNFTTDFESFTEGTIAHNYIQAIEESEVITITKEALGELYSKSPLWQSAGMALISKECARLSERVSSLSFETAKDKYQDILTNQPELIQRVPVQYIASYIGVSRETLSRIRQQISKE